MSSIFDKERTSMSSVSLASNTANVLVAKVEQRTRSRMLAYEFIARHVGRSVTWVRALVAERINRIDHDVFGALDALLKHEIEAEIARLQHELEVARQCGDHPCSVTVSAAETHLARAKALMGGIGNS